MKMFRGAKGMKRFSEYFTKDGSEQPDPTPVAPPVGYERNPSLAERIQAIVRSEQMALAARSAGYETFEESEDFDVDDDFDPQSPWENDFDPPVEELRKREAEAKAKGDPMPSVSKGSQVDLEEAVAAAKDAHAVKEAE